MNKRQKQVLQHQLADESQAVDRLRRVYAQAAVKVEERVQALLARNDANTQTVIYQVQHQLALKKQIAGILDELNGEQFTTIDDYLQRCYTNGYIGAMYDIAGQVGAPVVMAPDPKQVVRAVQLDSKISKGLYEALGEDVSVLKRKISATISRGISTGMTYSQMAVLLSNNSNTGLYNAMRIVRTEGHRIQIQSALDAQHAAKDAGCDIVKQWDATLDGRTRPTHRQLDGQIREVDEPFETTNLKGVTIKADAPGLFGRASEDIHCRCALLQRAKWALDDEELETLKQRAAFHGLDKTEDFEDFRQKYLNAVKKPKAKKKAEKVQSLPDPVYTEDKQGPEPLRPEDWPAYFADTPTKRKQTQAFMDRVNAVEGADPDVLQLYRNMGRMESVVSNGVPLKINYTRDHHAVSYHYYTANGKLADVTVKIPKISGNGSVGTTGHELAHLIDLYKREDSKSWRSMKSPGLLMAFQEAGDDVGGELRDLFKKYNEECDRVGDAVLSKARAEMDAFRQDKDFFKMSSAEYKAARKKLDQMWNDACDEADEAKRAAMGGGISNLQDILDAMTGGKARDTGIVKYGHGTKYYRNYNNRITETWANYCSLSVTRPDLIEMLKRDKPDLVNALHDLVVEINEEVGRK